MTPRMLVATRFGIGIQDPAWFEHRLVLLAAITASSLMSQDDQSFDWVLRVDASLSDEVRERLAEILSPFEGRAHICVNDHHKLMELVEERGLVDRSGRLLVGRIDDDDAWDRYSVAEVRKRVTDWAARGTDAKGYGLSFNNGFVWLMYDMIELDQLRRRGVKVVCKASLRSYTHPFTSISGYAYSSASDALTTLYTSHAEAPGLMESRGYTVDVVTAERPMWLYCRHKQTDSSVDRGEGPNLGSSVSDLETMFGIDATQTEQYIASSDQYEYCMVMQKFDKRGQLVQEVREIEQQRRTEGMGAREVAKLERKRTQLLAELTNLSRNVTGSPGDPSQEVSLDSCRSHSEGSPH